MAQELKKATKPTWYDPLKSASLTDQPVLKVYNSLTKEKVEFRSANGKTIKWYNCGPTVYDAAHLGHARNYMSQDIVRRILIDYFGYDVHFVMNITDIDDKIIIRARHNHLLDQLRATSTVLSEPLLTQANEAWRAYFASKLKTVALPKSGSPADIDAAWSELLNKEKGDEKWWSDAKAADEKFTMHIASLRKAKEGINRAATAISSNQTSQTDASALIDATSDVLAPYLDAKLGSSLTDPSISRRLAAHWESAFYSDMSKLRILPADTITRVTEYVPEIVQFVQQIVRNGYAYATEDGSVYFDTRAFDGGKARSDVQGSEQEWSHFYAKLQPGKKGNKEALEEGEGALSSGASKRFPADFALWKASKPGEPAWPSPWGPGRPGWHIECSVMASEIFGDNMDIHSGGIDLCFPHHDNEIAQSEVPYLFLVLTSIGSQPRVFRLIMIAAKGLKMSKSLKNFITVQDALEMYSARQLRLAFLGQLWSSPMDFKQSTMLEVKARESSINNFFSVVKALVIESRSNNVASDQQHHYNEPEKELAALLIETQNTFRVALCDSFNTPDALDRLLELISRTNVYLQRGRSNINVNVVERVAGWVTKMLRMFGLGEGPVTSSTIGWGEVEMGGTNVDVDRDAILMPYLKTLSSFRDGVRQLAIQQASAKEILALCDKLRDEDLAPLGVALDDQEDGKALVKLVNPEVLLRARDEKAAAAAAKAAKKAAAVEAERAKKAARLEKGKISPTEMFKPPNVEDGLYGSWDDKGIPVTDNEGKDISKAKSKKLAKEWEIQDKLHREWKEWLEAEKGE